MNLRIAHITLLIDDYDKAIDFFTRKLNFILVEDTKLSDVKRWVLVKPQGSENCCLLLAKASNDEQKRSIGNQSGGRVFLFLQTDNFTRDYQKLIDNGIRIVREPKTEDYGTVAVFEDIYGNLWDLIEPSKSRLDKK
jgi:catechol 2,3-dioxygenase-like lactoylglutathione lyase family enzyme